MIFMKPGCNNNINKELVCIETYNDHRIALSLSPLVLLGWELQIDNPLVINKVGKFELKNPKVKIGITIAVEVTKIKFFLNRLLNIKRYIF